MADHYITWTDKHPCTCFFGKFIVGAMLLATEPRGGVGGVAMLVAATLCMWLARPGREGGRWLAVADS